MMEAITPVDAVPALDREEAARLSRVEYERFADQLRSLAVGDWTKRTECPAWDVRAMAAHVLGMMEGFSSLREFVHQMSSAKKAAGDGPFIDGLTAVQVRDRSDLSPPLLLERIVGMGPRASRSRRNVPGPLRRITMKQEVGGVEEKWRFGYLLDVILTRDCWMHRIDIARATDREFHATPDHDGRIVADVVAEWGRRHGAPFTLRLGGPAGGVFTTGTLGEEFEIDAIEFCRTLSGRARGAGLLGQEVPF